MVHLAGLLAGDQDGVAVAGVVVIMLVSHDGERGTQVRRHQVGILVVQRVAATAFSDGLPGAVVDVLIAAPLRIALGIRVLPAGHMIARDFIDVVTGMRDQVDIAALAHPGIAIEVVLPPGGAGHMADGQFGDALPDRRCGSRAADGRPIAQGGERVPIRRGRLQTIGIHLDREVPRRIGHHLPAVHDLCQLRVCRDDPAHGHTGKTLWIWHLGDIPASRIGNGDPRPENHPVRQRVARGHGMPKRDKVSLGRVVPIAAGQLAGELGLGLRAGRTRHRARTHCCGGDGDGL